MRRLLLLAVFTCIVISGIKPIFAAEDELYIDIPILEDTYIEQGFPEVSPWNNRNLYLGRDTWYEKGETKILLKPDLRELDNLEIRAEDITDAVIQVELYQAETSSSSVTLSIVRLLEPWSIYSVNWTNKPNTSTETELSELNTTIGRQFIRVTENIKYLLANPSINYGLEVSVKNSNILAVILWANGCSVAPTLPRCASEEMAPILRVFYKKNQIPSSCKIDTNSGTISNSESVQLTPLASSDIENDSIMYQGRVCTDITCDTVVWQGGISPDETIYAPVSEDGTYFVQCSANDYHQAMNWGEMSEYTVDTQPPEIPTIINEPEFTGTLTNNIFILVNDEISTTYQLLYSERASFSAYNTYSEWIAEGAFEVEHTKEKTFYYKVRSKDLAGNISDWSEVTSTTIDTTYPTIKYFKSTKDIISPQKMKDGYVEGAPYIQGGVEDENIKEIILHIFTKEHIEIYTESTSDKSYLWTHWPDKLSYEDNAYYMILEGIDSTSRNTFSDPLFLTLDKTSPPLAIVSGTTDNKVHSVLPIKIRTTCKDSIASKVYLGNKLLGDEATSYNLTLEPKEGTHTLKITCIDEASNKSERKIILTVDTKPPSKPSLSLTYDEKKKQVIGKVYCREAGKVNFYVGGSKITSSNCKAKKYASAILSSTPPVPSYFSAETRVSDLYGNWSLVSTKSIYIKAPTAEIPKSEKTECVARYNITTKKLLTFSCSWTIQMYASYLKTVLISKNMYESVFHAYSPGQTKINLHLLKCKKRSFFDIRTWFGCYEEKVNSITVMGKTYPQLSSKFGVSNLSKEEISVDHEEVQRLEISQKLVTVFNYQYGRDPINGYVISQKINKEFVLNYPKSSSKKIFGWLFSKLQQVTQWHGNTAYQKPHGGIDFSVYKQNIIVPADGKIVSVAKNKINTCFSGGHYVSIQHNNGMYTYYFHLDSLKTPAGITLRPGMNVKKGQVLMTSGNSGLYNCQKLAYHLHFELRTSRDSTSHINPVPYFDINWSNIKTSRANIFPGRLSGDNPHPKF